MLSNETYLARARAEAGAAFLDKEVPGWDDKIDLLELRMESGCFCIGGQVVRKLGRRAAFRDTPQYTGLRPFHRFMNWCHRRGHEDLRRLGFIDGNGTDYHHLDLAWGRLIRARRRAKAAA